MHRSLIGGKYSAASNGTSISHALNRLPLKDGNSNMNYRSIIFDLDGTLLDTLPDIVVAVNEVLENMGVPTHPQESIREFIGSGVTVLFERAIPKTMPLRDYIFHIDRYKKRSGTKFTWRITCIK